MIVVLVVWCVEIVWFYFSGGLRILTRKPGVREETDSSKLKKLPDVMRSFFDGFATISSLSMMSCAFFRGVNNSLAANGGWINPTVVIPPIVSDQNCQLLNIALHFRSCVLIIICHPR